MYTITFYSFKGGVGRTMALVNVAAQLAKMGRKVLVVDFDLEAPGLETFERLRPPQPHAGLVEFVTEYVRSMRSPDVREYIYSVDAVGKKGGQLRVMPAGRRDRDYHLALSRLDWRKLYDDFDGFLLFEDLKAQWEQEYKPDYVLIDSRTGHCDVKGICTRQLPDAVVMLFFPNEQNLVGLRSVCREIRREGTDGLRKNIRLHYVMSNVPDLDDEDRVLRLRQEAFHKDLGIHKLDAIIHRYESVMLFNQAIFVLERPRSRLTREYRRLKWALISKNPADRDGALRFLHQYAQRYLPEVARDIAGEVKRKLGVTTHPHISFDIPKFRMYPKSPSLDQIADNFLDDDGVLLQLAQCRILAGDFRRALKTLDRVLALKPALAPALFQRAMCKNRLGDSDGTVQDLLQCLQAPGLDRVELLRTLRELATIAPEALSRALALPTIRELDMEAKGWVGVILASSRLPQPINSAVDYLKDVVDGQHIEEFPVEKCVRLLVDYLIRSRRWQEARDYITWAKNATTDNEAFLELSLDDLVAQWGLTGTPPEQLCQWWLEHAHNEVFSVDVPLLHQVNAIAWWRSGDASRALAEIEITINWMGKLGRAAFSFWRYCKALPSEFREDCEEIRRMIQGDPISPAFLG